MEGPLPCLRGRAVALPSAPRRLRRAPPPVTAGSGHAAPESRDPAQGAGGGVERQAGGKEEEAAPAARRPARSLQTSPVAPKAQLGARGGGGAGTIWDIFYTVGRLIVLTKASCYKVRAKDKVKGPYPTHTQTFLLQQEPRWSRSAPFSSQLGLSSALSIRRGSTTLSAWQS